MRIYLDESGYSGSNLMSAETVFVLASSILSDEESEELFNKIFHSLPSNSELKHSELRRTNPELVVDFIRHINEAHPGKFGAFAMHKKYSIVAKFTDSWVEQSFYELGLDFYQNNMHRSFAILLFFALVAQEDPLFCRQFLTDVQNMMNNQNVQEAKKFFENLEAALPKVSSSTRKFLEMIVTAAKHLGDDHVESLHYALDLAIPALTATTAHWRNQTDEELYIFHDRASELEKRKWTWDGMSSSDAPEKTFTTENTTWQFPLNVKETKFVDSIKHRQVQFCDLIAGALAEVLRYHLGDHCDKEYAEKLSQAGVESLLFGWTWPRLEDATYRKETYDHQGQISYFVERMKNLPGKPGSKKSKSSVDFVSEAEQARTALKSGENEKAFQHIKKLADAQHPYFQMLLAEMYDTGCGVEIDKGKSIACYQAAAKRGFAPAQRHLALKYLRAETVTQSDAKAFELMSKAANQGDPSAQHDLGSFYFRGIGVEASMEMGCSWHEKAAEQGFADSQRELASAYMQGDGRLKDRYKAYALYEKAAEGGDFMAQFFFGQMHQQGDHCEKDMVTAFE